MRISACWLVGCLAATACRSGDERTSAETRAAEVKVRADAAIVAFDAAPASESEVPAHDPQIPVSASEMISRRLATIGSPNLLVVRGTFGDSESASRAIPSSLESFYGRNEHAIFTRYSFNVAESLCNVASSSPLEIWTFGGTLASGERISGGYSVSPSVGTDYILILTRIDYELFLVAGTSDLFWARSAGEYTLYALQDQAVTTSAFSEGCP